MENEKNILEQILENTQEVKQVVVKEKKEPKELTAQQKAQSKFKKVGTMLNEAEQERLKAILEANNTNANAYIKKLIFSGIEEDNRRLLAQHTEFKNNISKLESDNAKLLEENKSFKEQIYKLQDRKDKKCFFEKLLARLGGK